MTLIALGPVRLALLAAYALLSMTSFVLHGMDKAAAKQGRWRTTEATLHLLAVAGGWPGALVGQRVFRHKTTKRLFRVIFWCTVIANCIATASLLVVLGPPAAMP